MHRADRFGLAQLYQLRGRVGRAKLRAYALFTLPAQQKITAQAERRLKVLQSLDTLGAGFQLASHDLDIRGAGNLLGEEQSGHIKEVGFELYQQMLEEAVMSLKAGITAPVADRWSPQITIGTPVLIPEDYVADLSVRLALYRRLAEIEDEGEIEAFAAELVDRFGKLPGEVEHLLQVVAIKALCRRANVEKIEAGPKGVVLSFRDNIFANPEGLIGYIREQGAARAHPQREERPAPGVPRRMGSPGAAPERHRGDPAQARRNRRAGQGGVTELVMPACPGHPAYRCNALLIGITGTRAFGVAQDDEMLMRHAQHRLDALAGSRFRRGAVDVGEIVERDQPLDREAAGGDVIDQLRDERLAARCRPGSRRAPCGRSAKTAFQTTLRCRHARCRATRIFRAGISASTASRNTDGTAEVSSE